MGKWRRQSDSVSKWRFGQFEFITENGYSFAGVEDAIVSIGDIAPVFTFISSGGVDNSQI